MSLCVLKGHLLAEELLTEYISTRLPHFEHLQIDRNHWGFANKLELAASVSSNQHHDVWVWGALKKLNSLRNKLSHGLEPTGLDQSVQDFQQAVKPHAPSKFQGKEVTIYGYVLFTVSGLFVVFKSSEGKIA